ncbi:MAG: rod shape-determining protein MreC [Clostridia bacterium]|nr:rod shape-determining protein MreC [Clostridia bacterium]
MLRLFKSKLFILVLTTLVILIVMGVSTNQNSSVNQFGNVLSVILSPGQKFLSYCGQKMEGSFTFFNDIKAVKKENEELKARLDQLEKERIELEDYKVKNKELREALNLKDQFGDYVFLGANIIAKDPGNWFDVFNIDRGSKDGISSDYPVITSKGLVGKVTTPGLLSSKVIAIIDSDSTVSARISKTRDLVLVRGDLSLKDQGLCRMDYIPPDADIAVGDTIETSGVGGIFPKGIVIGKVKKVLQDNSVMTRYAVIEPAVDFKRLEEVLVLKEKVENKSSETGNVK